MGNPKSEKGRFTKDGEMIISPKEYVLPPNESRFSFKNLYIQYGRFHADEMNTLIHIICIPFIVITIYGLVYKSELLGNITFDMSKGGLPIPQIGRFDGVKTDQIIVLDTVFTVWLLFCFVYAMADPVIGVVALIFFNLCFHVLRNLIDRDMSDEKLFGGNVRTYVLYVHLLAWVF